MTVVQRFEGMPCRCDVPAPASRLISIDEALTHIADQIGPVETTERVSLHKARGRVLAASVFAQADMPRFDHSAMDGFALRVSDLEGEGPWLLSVALRCAAGSESAGVLTSGSAAHIFTGAPIPRGADCVVMQEEVDRRDGGILLARKPNAHENIRHRGEEYRQGAKIVSANCRVTSRSVAAAASSGIGSLEVRARVRVSLLVTGTEVARAGKTGLGDAQIWDVNTPMLQSVLTRPDVEIVVVEALRDSAVGIREALKRAARWSDLVVTTGGVSVGEEDHLHSAVREAGGVIHFSGVALKPGKPVTFGEIGRVAWLGLPGNPQSAFVTWALFGEAILARLSGLNRPDVGKRHVVLGHELRRKPGRCEIRAGRLTGHDGMGRDVVDCRRPVNSGQVGALCAADGLAYLPADADCLPKGALIEFLPFCPS